MNEEIVNAAIARCIDQLKREHGWSLSQIADKIGINYEPMRNLARGHVKRPYLDVVLKLHQLAGVGMDEAFGLASAPGGDEAKLRRRISSLESSLQDLELEKRLLLDWIRRYSGEGTRSSDSTMIRFLNPGSGPSAPNHGNTEDEDVCCCDST